MKENRKRIKEGGGGRGFLLIVPIILVFCVLGGVVFSVSRKLATEMSQSAVDNLGESLDLIKRTVEVIIRKEAEFQKLMAKEIASMEDPWQFIYSYERGQSIVMLSMIPAGETEGISNTGERFSEEGLDFSAGKTVDDLPISESYLNSLGTWAYTMKCPVSRDGEKIATLYVEYIFDSFERTLPNRFYNGSATIYIMDGESERFVLKPRGAGEREAGHINLSDFYEANIIQEPDIQEHIASSIKAGENVMFYHDIQEKESLVYMWAVNDGGLYLIGYVPIEAIQQEGRTVNQNIFIVVIVMLVAFVSCCTLYLINKRQQDKVRLEREQEREIHNKQLAEALQTAQIASSSKTTFLSNMSHDIRTPMNAILGFTTLLAKDADDPVKVREYTKKITSSGQHLLSLINDVLDVSKIESGKVALNMGRFNLNSMVSSVDTIIRPAAKAKGQNLEVIVTGIRHENLIGDETRLNQVLINLLSNAVKYTQEGGDLYFRMIGLAQRTSQYEHIQIEVEDNGYGMSPEYLEVLFDAFTRAENSTTNKVQGTGLGMAITKNIVELMGGTIDVLSEVDKGTLFTVDLELRIPDGEADEEFWKKNNISRILVVDDDEDICRNIQMLMEDTGVQVDTALCGEEAVRMVQEAFEGKTRYEVVLLDQKMPGMNGMETAKQIRTVIPDPVLIIFLTAYDWDEIKDEASEIGVDGFLAKPFFVSAFREKLHEIGSEEETVQDVEGEDEHILEGRHFLVAEDNEINAEILEELLDVEGATCEIMENGQLTVERFAKAEPGEFDAILMDVQMPVMNGYDATRMIRAMEREDAKNIIIIAMTANAFAEDVRDAMDAGMTAHIAKPIDMGLLKKMVELYLFKEGV